MWEETQRGVMFPALRDPHRYETFTMENYACRLQFREYFIITIFI